MDNSSYLRTKAKKHFVIFCKLRYIKSTYYAAKERVNLTRFNH